MQTILQNRIKTRHITYMCEDSSDILQIVSYSYIKRNL